MIGLNVRTGPLLLLICLMVINGGCRKLEKKSDEERSEKKKEAENRGVLVELGAVERGEIEYMIKASAPLVVERVTPVYARTANLVREILVEEGDYVKKGQPLLQLEDDVQKTAYQRAQVQFERTEREYQRNQALYEQGLVSEQVFVEQEFTYRERKLALEDARREYEFTKIIAPISGMITSRDAKVGFPLNIGSSQTRDGVFQIMDFETMQAEIHVPSRYVSMLKSDLVARVYATPFPDQVFEGYVKRIAPVVASQTGTVEVIVGFKDYGPLLPGMYVDVELILSKKSDALLISKRAIVYDNQTMFVYRMKEREGESEPRRVERLLLQPQMTDKFNVEPQVDVFAPGDQLVMVGQTGLKDNAIVRLPGDPDPERESHSENRDDKTDKNESAD